MFSSFKKLKMANSSKQNAFILGIFIFLGLSALGYLLAHAAIEYKEYERTVNVKGLSEREFVADVVIWPIQFTLADNSLENIYSVIDANTSKIKKFLIKKGLNESEISISAPNIIDKLADQWGDRPVGYRYTATQSMTVYSKNIKLTRSLMKELSELGKQGIVFRNDQYDTRPEYLFTRLNEVKPEMIAEATMKAREVAEKFAADSHSTLGKIKRASQGQFSIYERDRNNPHIKKVRVVSTVVYYLSD